LEGVGEKAKARIKAISFGLENKICDRKQVFQVFSELAERAE